MIFYNNQHAAQAILTNRHNRLHGQVAAERTTLATNDSRHAPVARLPRAESAAPAAAA